MNDKNDRRFWDFISNNEDNTAELLLYGEISQYSWYGDEVTPAEFNNELKELGPVDEIIVRINSGGGDVFAAMAIYTRLKEHSANITVKIDGWCASAATIIAMAGDSIEISVGGIFMIHDPSVGLLGHYDAEELNKLAEELKTVKQSIVNCYMTVSDKSEDEIKNLMASETWFTGNEAVEAGFCTSVMFTEVETEVENAERIIVNSVSMDIRGFDKLPRVLLNKSSDYFNNVSDKNGLLKSCLNNNISATEDRKMTLEEFKRDYPDIADAYKSEIMADASASTAGKERERMKAIDDNTLPGYEDLAYKAKYENPVSAAEFAMQIISAQKEAGRSFLNARDDDIKNSGMKEVKPASNKGQNTEEDPFGDIIDQKYPKAE